MLDAFSSGSPIWRGDDLIEFIGVSSATGYRYIKSLFEAGLLARVANGSYVIGPRILELDRISRQSDPIYSIGTPLLKNLTSQTGMNALLSVLYSDSVMCVQQEPAPGGDVPKNLFSRGQRRPLIGGASANVILAFLPPHQLKALFMEQRKTIASAGMGTSWNAFRSTMRIIRDRGYCVTRAEYQRDITGLAAPIFNTDREVLGSIALATHSSENDTAELLTFIDELLACAHMISDQIANSLNSMAMPARSLK
jgi:DNA-binding IclR family transcriptional regulator